MQHLAPLNVMERAVRQRVCPHCHLRPDGSETLGPDEPRSCQDDCTIFRNLPKLRLIVAKVRSQPTMSPYLSAMRELICQNCDQSPTAGDFCSDRTTMSCPLARYGNEVIDALEQVAKTTRSVAQKQKRQR